VFHVLFSGVDRRAKPSRCCITPQNIRLWTKKTRQTPTQPILKI